METAGLASPLSYIEASPSADQTTGGTAGVWQTLNFQTTTDSVLNGIMDKPTDSRLRALVRGYYEIFYTVNASFANNQRGGILRAIRNGVTVVGGSFSTIFANSGGISNAGSGSNKRIVLLEANDYIEIQANPHRNSAMTIHSESSFGMSLVRPA